MDVGQIKGHGGLDQGPKHGESVRHDVLVPVRRAADHAVISSESKDALIQATDRTDRAKLAPEVRHDRVAEAKQRLESGALDSPEILRATAERILGDDS